MTLGRARPRARRGTRNHPKPKDTTNPPFLFKEHTTKYKTDQKKKKRDEFPGFESKKRLKGMKSGSQAASSAKYTPGLTLPPARDPQQAPGEPGNGRPKLGERKWGVRGRRGMWGRRGGYSQASFPSKLERAMAKACRAHSG